MSCLQRNGSLHGVHAMLHLAVVLPQQCPVCRKAASSRPHGLLLECAMCSQTTVIEEDKEFVHSYFDMPDEDFPVHRQSPWLLRITLNRDLMVDKKLSLEAIAERINTEFEDELHCIFNDDNAEVPALRVCPAHARITF